MLRMLRQPETHTQEEVVSLQGSEGRIAKIGRLLLWEGRVSRGRLITKFDLSDTRASEWLREFREAFPDWTRWDAKRRAYIATPLAYKRAEDLGRDTITPMLAEMLTPYAGPGPVEPGVVPWEFHQPSPLTFSRLNIAIADRLQVQVVYRSMTHPAAHPRTIEPHSLMLAGRRWHVRGCCIETSCFRDFVLGRMSDVRVLPTPRTVDPGTDTAWATIVRVRFVAHPKLTPEQQLVVRDEFFRGTGARIESCRGALVSHMIQELRAAIDIERQAPPDYQLAVDNIKECRPWLVPN